MSLLQNEETSYLTNIKDGIGERLINVDSSVLNDPCFRAAGWTADIAEIKRTYSPPIPTAITSDYFSAPPRSAGFAPAGFNDEDDEGGMISKRGSTETVAPGPNVRRRRHREQQEEDDSSDLSDESDGDTEGTHRAAQQIKFSKMPVRNRSGSSPIRGSGINDGVNALVPPYRRSSEGRLRRGSLGAVETVKQRARRDTATSSEMSSENEIEPSIYKRRHVNPKKAAKTNSLLAEKHMEDDLLSSRVASTINEDSAEDSDRTSLSSEFAEAVEAGSLLDDVPNPLNGSPLTQLQPLQTPISLSPISLRKPRHQSSSLLLTLPPPRPISRVQPISLLGEAIRAGRSKPKNPIEIFARLSGKGSLDPLNIRIYAPFSETPTRPIDMPILRHAPDAGAGEKGQVSVAEAIGLSLWRYHEESFKPPIEGSKLNVNRWTFRMVEDGEVDYEFPALSRTKPMVDFTYNNNNRTARARSREKSYDEFALVEATDAQFKENQALTPKYEQLAKSAVETTNETAVLKSETDRKGLSGPQANGFYSKPIAGPADKGIAVTNSTPRMGPSKTLKIHFTSLEAFTQITTIEVTTDTYLAEVLDIACKRFKIDKAYHILKVTGTNTVAPVDRYVEAVGARLDLDLVRRRFVNEGTLGLAGSPGSSSPNAPLLLTSGTPKKGKGGSRNPFTAAHLQLQPLAQRHQDLLLGSTTKYKKYNVVRKQPMSFAPSQQRVILMDEDYMHILPSESGKTLFDISAKTNRIPFSMIVGCKVSRRHPKTFRVIIFRERETKRYDFEALTVNDASEIVEEIIRGMEPYQGRMMHGIL